VLDFEEICRGIETLSDRVEISALMKHARYKHEQTPPVISQTLERAPLGVSSRILGHSDTVHF
jgi:hypothetical protein